MFDQIFLLPNAKQRVIFSNKHGICELPHELLNHFRYSWSWEIRKYQKNLIRSQPSAQSSKMKILSIFAKNSQTDLFL